MSLSYRHTPRALLKIVQNKPRDEYDRSRAKAAGLGDGSPSNKNNNKQPKTLAQKRSRAPQDPISDDEGTTPDRTGAHLNSDNISDDSSEGLGPSRGNIKTTTFNKTKESASERLRTGRNGAARTRESERLNPMKRRKLSNEAEAEVEDHHERRKHSSKGTGKAKGPSSSADHLTNEHGFTRGASRGTATYGSKQTAKPRSSQSSSQDKTTSRARGKAHASGFQPLSDSEPSSPPKSRSSKNPTLNAKGNWDGPKFQSVPNDEPASTPPASAPDFHVLSDPDVASPKEDAENRGLDSFIVVPPDPLSPKKSPVTFQPHDNDSNDDYDNDDERGGAQISETSDGKTRSNKHSTTARSKASVKASSTLKGKGQSHHKSKGGEKGSESPKAMFMTFGEDEDLDIYTSRARSRSPLSDMDSDLDGTLKSPRETEVLEAPTVTYCPWCGDVVDDALLKSFSKGKRLNVRQQTRFCRQHKKHSADEIWRSKSYPEIDWMRLPDRIDTHNDLLLEIIDGSRPSFYRAKLADNIEAGRDRALKKEENLNPGYYGPRGFNLMCDRLVERFGDLLKQKAVQDRIISGRGSAAFIQSVLVAELAVQLISEDMSVPSDEARVIMEESKSLGEIVHEES